jgi:phage terminase large subunit-like protein
MAGNAVAVGNSNGDIRLHKARSKKKIDGLAALVNAIAAMSADTEGASSVYEDRGVITL